MMIDPRLISGLLPGQLPGSLMVPQVIQPESVKPAIEIVPGLVVEPRFINGNWWLVPVGNEDHLPDVESMVIRELAREIEAGEMTMGDKCCLINALSERRRAQVETLRNVMGLLGTDKPLPITEVPPLAMVEGPDAMVNALPTAESTGNPIFDAIDYTYDCYETGVYNGTPRYGTIHMGADWNTFKVNDVVLAQVFRISDNQPVSPEFEFRLKHGIWQNQCWPEDQWHIYSKYGEPADWFGYAQRTGFPPEIIEGSCGHMESIWKHPTRPWEIPFPGGDALMLEISMIVEYEPQLFHIVPNNLYYVRVMFKDKSRREFGINLHMEYYDHVDGRMMSANRSYSKYHRDRALMEHVLREEIKVLDNMRVDGLINAPQWTAGKEILENYATVDFPCPAPTIETIYEPPHIPTPEIIIPEIPELPPIPEIPEIPPIELPPIIIPEIPPPPIIEPPVFPRKTCCPYDAFLEELFGGSP